MQSFDDFMREHLQLIRSRSQKPLGPLLPRGGLRTSKQQLAKRPIHPCHLTATGRIKKRKYPHQARKQRPFIPESAYMLADPCVYCGSSSHHFDHIEPLTQGGVHEVANLAPVCWPCNRQKGTQKLIVFLAKYPTDSDSKATVD